MNEDRGRRNVGPGPQRLVQPPHLLNSDVPRPNRVFAFDASDGAEKQKGATMKIGPRIVAGILTTTCGSFGGAVGGSAQSVTELPARSPFPEPRECRIEPRTPQDVISLLNSTPTGEKTTSTQSTMVAEIFATIEARAQTFALPVGEEADVGTITSVERTLTELYACYNARNVGSAMALLTDDAIRRFPGGKDGFSLLDQLGVGAPEPLEQNYRLGYTDTSDVTILPDGRVGALIGTLQPDLTGRTLRADYWYFREVEGRLFVDDVVFGVNESR